MREERGGDKSGEAREERGERRKRRAVGGSVRWLRLLLQWIVKNIAVRVLCWDNYGIYYFWKSAITKNCY